MTLAQERPPTGPPEVLEPHLRTLPALLQHQAERRAGEVLLRRDDGALSYREVRDLVAGRAGLLVASGIGRGDRVAIVSDNRREALELILACGWIGAIAVPLNVAVRGPALEHALRNCGARLAICDHDVVDILLAASRASQLREVWTLGGEAKLDHTPRLRPLPAAEEPVPAAIVCPGETLAIFYTSGTTGPAKGVCCPHAQFYWWGVRTGRGLGVRESDVLFTCLPLFHTNAFNAFVQALVVGASYAVAPRFSASRFWLQLAEAGGTVTYLLGAMVPILLQRPTSPDDRAHRARVALAPATPPDLVAPFRDRFGIELVEAYGSTETNYVIANPVGASPACGMGRVLDGFEADVVDDNDNAVDPGRPGELVLRSREPYSFATGYFGMPEETVAAWRNLWFHTGDRVVREADGTFRFVDRMKDAIRRRGENISAFEVEQALLSHPHVAHVAAFPVPSELAEDEVMASVVPREGAELDLADLIRHCEALLASFAIPRFIDVVDALPTTATGKVSKLLLRERGVTQQTWDRESAGRPHLDPTR